MTSPALEPESSMFDRAMTMWREIDFPLVCEDDPRLASFLEPLRRLRGIACRILNIAMPEIGLDRPRVVAIVGELIATGMAQHRACALMPRSAALAARSTMREKPSADRGAPRSETNRNVNRRCAVMC